MRTITCFGDRTSGTFLMIALVSQMKKTQSHGQITVNLNVFNGVAPPHVLSYCCILHYFSMSVGFNLTLG